MGTKQSIASRDFWVEVLRMPLSLRYWIGGALGVSAALILSDGFQNSAWRMVAGVVCICTALEVWLRVNRERPDAGTDSPWAFTATAAALGAGMAWFPRMTTLGERVVLVGGLVAGYMVVQVAIAVVVLLARGRRPASAGTGED